MCERQKGHEGKPNPVTLSGRWSPDRRRSSRRAASRQRAAHDDQPAKIPMRLSTTWIQGNVVMRRPRVRPSDGELAVRPGVPRARALESDRRPPRRTTSGIRRPTPESHRERSPASGARAWAPPSVRFRGSHRSCHGAALPDLATCIAAAHPSVPVHAMKATTAQWCGSRAMR